MNDATFHADRLTGIGSSEAPAACGVSRYGVTQLDVYLDKRGEVPHVVDEETQPMLFGKLLQPVILDEFARRTGAVFTYREDDARTMLRSDAHPFMLAHLDARTKDAVVEAKATRSGDGYGPSGSNELPVDHVVQVHHQMVVAKVRLAFVPVLIAGCDYRIYEVPFDAELGELIVAREAELWERIQRGDPPPVDPDAPGALEVIRRVYRGTNGLRMRASGEDEHWRAVYQDANARRERYAAAADAAKAHLLLQAGEAAELQFADGTVLRRQQVTRKGYAVAETTFMDCRFIRGK